ncbi:hypothetical protein ONE63_002706 [Megalurothrips usitatus]|uniref:Uncharacterized protein n=1 Tax=Megalurothrips usitatus TaxID=439358 RepID=A0AAV7XG50_9NEOP|nr:hypothetical protein ONE63_002706 [Megalurothrips usitatus]
MPSSSGSNCGRRPAAAAVLLSALALAVFVAPAVTAMPAQQQQQQLSFRPELELSPAGSASGRSLRSCDVAACIERCRSLYSSWGSCERGICYCRASRPVPAPPAPPAIPRVAETVQRAWSTAR